MATTTDLHAKAASYGVRYTGELVTAEYHDTVDRSRHYTLAEVAAAGGRITRLRLVTDPGFPWWDISYCHATLPSGQIVPVSAGVQLRKRSLKWDLVEWAKSEGANAKQLGLLNESVWARLY